MIRPNTANTNDLDVREHTTRPAMLFAVTTEPNVIGARIETTTEEAEQPCPPTISALPTSSPPRSICC